MSQPAAPANDRTTLWGVLGIVIGLFCCPIIGFLFGYLSLQDSKRYGSSPAISYAALAASAAGIVINIVLISTNNYPGWR